MGWGRGGGSGAQQWQDWRSKLAPYNTNQFPTQRSAHTGWVADFWVAGFGSICTRQRWPVWTNIDTYDLKLVSLNSQFCCPVYEVPGWLQTELQRDLWRSRNRTPFQRDQDHVNSQVARSERDTKAQTAVRTYLGLLVTGSCMITQSETSPHFSK